MRVILIIFITFVYLFANDSKEILKMIQILKNRDFTYQEIVYIYNPFIKNRVKEKKMETKQTVTDEIEYKTSYQLEAIFQNRVRINNVWYKNGDKLDKYIIIIGKNSVYLKDKNRLIRLKRAMLIKVTK
jgi:hypothetical protein